MDRRTVWVNYEYYTKNWLERANRTENEDYIDIIDKFISLWIAFNGWMKNTFGEGATDRKLIEYAIEHPPMQEVFSDLQKNNAEFGASLERLGGYRIVGTKESLYLYDGSLSSLLEFLYQVRCNLFHGRKDTVDRDLDIIRDSFQVLIVLFEDYLSKNEGDWHF
ncbi:MAG: hypothetical protein PHU95_05735 [Candidatus Thermoplasmatota archaeon]|nr:hypothetical protein [Candidatus Thermoplasmatota archaeon]MDD5778928.1 hypothetical protein [Candidatus Thermoplasmatota archaeon]